MTMSILVMSLLMAYTLVFAIQEEKLPTVVNKIVNKLKEKHDLLDQLFSCSFCLGFWTGNLSYLLVQGTSIYLGQSEVSWSILFFSPFVGLGSSAFCYLCNQFTLMGADVEAMPDLPPELEAQLQEHFSSLENEEPLIHQFSNRGGALETMCDDCEEEQNKKKTIN